MDRKGLGGRILVLAGMVGLPAAAPAWNALSYEQALALCANGYQEGCNIAYQYAASALQQGYGSGYGDYGGGSPADAWLSPGEVQQVRPGPLSTYDFLR